MQKFMSGFLILALSLPTLAQNNPPQPTVAQQIEIKQQQMLTPMVRVKCGKATGSGTVIYSEDREKDGTYKTFVLTNHHVVSEAIKIEKKWNNLKQKFEDVEVLDKVVVEFFKYTPDGQENGRIQFDSDIIAYEADEDLALLQINVKVDNVAKMLPDKCSIPRIFEKVYAVGCSLAEPPLPSCGEITSTNKTIDRRDYWMISANIVFGDSGGAVFLERDNNYWWIGVPSRVASTGNQIIPHMAYMVPITRIKSWFTAQKLTFLINDKKTPTECFKEREALRNPEPKEKVGP